MYIVYRGKWKKHTVHPVCRILYVDFKGLSNVNAWPSVNAKHTLFFVVT